MPTEIVDSLDDVGNGIGSVSSSSAATQVSWPAVLHEAKQLREDELFYERMRPFFQRFYEQMVLYGQALSVRHSENDDSEVVVGDDDSSTRLTKAMILETRAALRFATFCIANEVARSTVQREAIVMYGWHRPLCSIISRKKGDAKCRILCARLLSNLVTCNSETALVVASEICLSPSEESVASRIRTFMSVAIKQNDESEADTTWVDMILACAKSGCREGMGATVAALHNCISSVGPGGSFAKDVSSDQLLISTLLRQILPANSIPKLVNSEETHQGDSATEWIVLTIGKLCRLGLLPQMYSSAGGGFDANTAESLMSVTPEHLVLLHCAASAVDEATEPSNTEQKPFLGGEAGDDAIVSSHVFLATQFSSLRDVLSKNEESSNSDPELTVSASSLILEMLAASLGTDGHTSIEKARLYLGRETSFVQDVALDLGIIVDSLTTKNQGRKARELLMSENEQRNITGLVRLLGNVCFRCRQNQDLIRQTMVPFSNTSVLNDKSVRDERTALHVLLSCTSFSYGCFTLREWAIVALRNVLEGNEENQAVVERLEAQQPVQNAELESMGVRVDMDRQGEVRVVPTKDPNEPSKKQ